MLGQSGYTNYNPSKLAVKKPVFRYQPQKTSISVCTKLVSTKTVVLAVYHTRLELAVKNQYIYVYQTRLELAVKKNQYHF